MQDPDHQMQHPALPGPCCCAGAQSRWSKVNRFFRCHGKWENVIHVSRGWEEMMEGSTQREEGDPGAAWREGRSSGGKGKE